MTLPTALRRIYSLLPGPSRKQVGVLLFLMLCNAFSEVGGVAGILPLVTVAADPSLVQKQPQLHSLYLQCQSPDPHSFLVYLGGVYMLLLVIMNALNAATFWFSLRFSFDVGYRLSARILTAYLARPYLWFLSHNTSDLSKVVLAEVDALAETIVLSTAELLTTAMVSVFLVVGLLWLNPVVAITTAAALGVLYSVIYRSSRLNLNQIGTQRMDLNSQRHRAVHDSLNALKEARMFSRGGHFRQAFDERSHLYSRYRIHERLVAELPKYSTETLAIVAIGSVLMFLVWHGEEPQQVAPLVGLYSMATWRLVPALQTVYRNTVRVRFHAPVLELIERQLEGEPGPEGPPLRGAAGGVTQGPPLRGAAGGVTEGPAGRMPLHESVRANNITFTYPGNVEPALKGVTVDVPRGSIVALVGRTGSGKSTLADVLAGLLPPDSGEVEVDGKALVESSRLEWQRNVGYVPQEIFLTDDSVTRNVALGYPTESIDQSRVTMAARTARLADFIERELAQGYQTPLGERGVSLSGGQRQRVGIARAIYDNPELLILDEATSALDNLTEREVMEALQELASTKTLVLIAHRLTTVQLCKRIYMLENGRMIASGTYQELLESSPEFARLASTELMEGNHPGR